ncbi:MAG TPA: aminotransferase class IV, partial [Thermoflexales bacterium]|nr:aminotransferase class IV [Thermoflexales bacterium]
MVITYEVIGNSITQIGESADMSQAAKQLPQGAYTTFRTYDKTRLLRLGQHTQRLVESVALMGSPAPLSEETLRAVVAHVLQKNTDDRAESRVRITFAPPRLFVSVEPFTPYPQSLYEQGVMCVTVPLHRENPHAKNTAFSLVAKAAQAGLPSAAHEGLMLAEDGAILEGLSSNFFAIDAAGVLRTEQERVLMGVTRS